ncbi:MAG: gliding motility-associated C-terminal domain-containing protein [Bacteroidota bacterium]
MLQRLFVYLLFFFCSHSLFAQTIEFEWVNPTCTDPANGELHITVTGHTEDKKYILFNSSSEPIEIFTSGETTDNSYSFYNLKPNNGYGAYVLDVSESESFVINDDIQSHTLIAEPYEVSVQTIKNAGCESQCVGVVSATVVGGIEPFSFSWDDGVSGTYPDADTIWNVCVNDYEVTVTDAVGCVTSSPLPASVVPVEVEASVSNIQHIECAGQPSGSASASAINTTGAVSFEWSDGTVGMNNTDIYAGNHYVVATDAIGCDDTVYFEITEPANKLELFLDSTKNIRCKGMNIGEAYISSEYGITPLSYEWSDGGSGLDRTDLLPQYYQVVVIDDIGCSDTVDFTLTEPAEGVEGTIVSSSMPSCYGYQDGSAEVSVSGGLAPYSVQWDDAGNDSTDTDFIRNDLEKNVYTITIFDAEACENSVILDMLEPDELTAQILAPDNSPAQTSVDCYGDCDVDVKVVATGGTTPYVLYDWDNALPDIQTATLCAGTYSVTVTDNNGCTVTESHIVTQPPNLEVSIAEYNEIQCYGETGRLEAVTSGGVSPYVFSWSDGGTSRVSNWIPEGVYSVDVTDDNGCETNANYSLSQPDSLVLSFTIEDILCQDVSEGALTVNPVGGIVADDYSYSWNSGHTSATINNLVPQLYSVTVTDDNSCSTTDEIDLTNINEFGVVFDSEKITCIGRSDGEITASALYGNPPFLYEWRDGITDSARTGLSEGWYYVTITDKLGCTVTDSLFLETIPPMYAQDMGTTETPCNEAEGSAFVEMLGGTAPYSYLWSNGQTVDSIINLAVDSYSVLVTDDNGCTFSADFMVEDTSSLSVSVQSPDERIRCAGAATGEATAIPNLGTAPYTYDWSTGESTNTISSLDEGVYSVTVYDSFLCQATDSIELYEYKVLETNIIDSGMVSCYGFDNGYAVASVKGGVTPYSVSWSNGKTSYINANIGPGMYTFMVQDADGCLVSDSVQILEPTALTAIIDNTKGISCGGVCDGRATINVAGGVVPYSYEWTSGETTATANALCGGQNYITVTDDNACEYVDSVIIVDTMPRIGLDAFFIEPNCGIAEGEVAVDPFGGIPPYTFAWSTGDTDSLIQNVQADVYEVTVTDNAGCTLDTILFLQDNSTLTIDFERQAITFCDPCNESYVALPQNGTAPYSYEWSTGDLTALSDSLCPGEYVVQVTDANTCVRSALLTVEPVALSIDLVSQTNVLCFGESTGSVEVEASGGVSSSYSYNWSNGDVGAVATNLPAGTVEVSVSEDLSVCSVEREFTITQAPELQRFFITDTPSYCEDSTGEMHVELIGGTPPFTYEWETGEVGAAYNNAWPEYIEVTITDGNGCEIVDSGKVDDISDFSLFEKDRYLISCIGDADGELEVGMLNGYAPFTYSWSHNSAINTSHAENLASGEYIVEVTDSKNCMVSYTFDTLYNPDSIRIEFVELESIFCNNGTGKLLVQSQGGHPGYNYNWIYNDNIIESSENYVTNTPAGIYKVVAQDSRNCLSDTAQYEFENPPPISADFTVEITGCGSISHTGSIVVDTIFGPNPPYKFRWHDETTTTTWYDGSSNLERTDLPAGEYFITVFDSTGVCYEVFKNRTDPIRVTEIETSVEPTRCDFYSDEDLANKMPSGAVLIESITTQDGTYTDFTDFTFAWNDRYSQTVAEAQNLPMGDYSVSITGKNECVSTLFAGTVVPQIMLQPSIFATDGNVAKRTEICLEDSVQLEADVTESFNAGYSPENQERVFMWQARAFNKTADISDVSARTVWVTPQTDYYADSTMIAMQYGFDGCVSNEALFSIAHYDSVNFELQILDDNNMIIGTDSVFVIQDDYFTIEPTPPPWFVYKDSLVDGVDTIYWSSTNTTKTGRGQIKDIVTHEQSYNRSGTYSLNLQALVSSYYNAEAVTRNGCTETDRVYVHVFSDVFVPTGITPNNDGDNDTWVIPYLYSCPNAVVKIFNRWGAKVYESDGIYYTNPWDGRNKKGDLLPTGTYYYIIEYNDEKGTEPQAGSISVIY